VNLPFTTGQFLAVFEEYNRSVWPMQIFLNLLGILAIVLAFRKIRHADKTIACILVFLWTWIGVAYHFAFFTSINPAAHVFAVLNVLQALIFLIFGVLRSRLTFRFRRDIYGITATLFVLYALIIYPVLGLFAGHIYPRSPTFGLPCPTTIFTLGVLLWTEASVPKVVLIIPFLWSLIGFTAAVTMGMREDYGLLIAGVASLVMIIWRDRRIRTPGDTVPHST
jgi:hypothetical protein